MCKYSESREEYQTKDEVFVCIPEAPPIFAALRQISESREEYQTKYEVFVFFVEAHYSFSICVSV